MDVDVEKRLVEKKSGGLAAQRLERRQQNLEFGRGLLLRKKNDEVIFNSSIGFSVVLAR